MLKSEGWCFDEWGSVLDAQAALLVAQLEQVALFCALGDAQGAHAIVAAIAESHRAFLDEHPLPSWPAQ